MKLKWEKLPPGSDYDNKEWIARHSGLVFYVVGRSGSVFKLWCQYNNYSPKADFGYAAFATCKRRAERFLTALHPQKNIDKE